MQIRVIAAGTVAALVLADASIVTLALPRILTELDASVSGVAAVIGAYTLVLAVGTAVLSRAPGLLHRPGIAPAALLAFALASVGCGAADSMNALIGLRAVQGLAGAVVLLAAFDLLGRDDAGRHVWRLAAVVGAATGPAVGGTLTELLDWRAIFLFQAPVVAVAGLACLPGPAPAFMGEFRHRFDARALASLALLSAALAGVLFLLVLLLVSGWSKTPLQAAVVVSVLPIGAALGHRIGGPDLQRAAAGLLLVGAGVLSLAFLTTDSVLMTVLPQLVAGTGMGMALPALAGGLLPETSVPEAARLLTVRHVAITLALAAVAPLLADRLEQAAHDVRLQGTAVVLDARLPPQGKIQLVGISTADLGAIAPRRELDRALASARDDLSSDSWPEFDAMHERVDDALVSAVDRAFRPAFIVCGVLALLGAVLLAAAATVAILRALVPYAAIAGALVVGQAVAGNAQKPDPIVIADPCQERSLPDTGGILGFVQDRILIALDKAACNAHKSREALALELLRSGSPGDVIRALLG